MKAAPEGARVFDYEQGITRLVARVRVMDGDWSSTPLREDINRIAAELERLADDLDSYGVAQCEIEREHDRESPDEIARDGARVPAPDWGTSYQGTILHMRGLAGSARHAAGLLPSARAKQALPFAAIALLHLRYQHDYARPAISDRSPDALELARVCELAKKPRAPETIRNALSKALKSFDPHYFPGGVYEVVYGG